MPSSRRLLAVLVVVQTALLFAAPRMHAQSSAAPPPTTEEIDAWVEDAMARWEVPGLGLAIVHEGESYLSAGYGVRELGRDTPMDGATLFSIGSCSKAFGAATIASLVEEGKLRWDDRITDHIPWFRLHDPWTTREIRVRDIVTHRVGTGSNQPLRPLVTDRRDYLMRIPHTDPDHAFRDRYGYTNDMFVLTGHLVETLSGTDWDSYAREKLWSPLGMTTTTARMAPANASPNHAEPHAIIERRFIGNAATTGMPLEPVPWQYVENVTVPSGGVITSADEITEWMRFHLGSHPDPPLSRSSVELMHAPHTVIRNPSSWMPFEGPGAYAMGWSTGRFGDVTGVGHGGNALGFNCSIALAPEQGFGLAALAVQQVEGRAVQPGLQRGPGRPRPARRGRWRVSWARRNSEAATGTRNSNGASPRGTAGSSRRRRRGGRPGSTRVRRCRSRPTPGPTATATPVNCAFG